MPGVWSGRGVTPVAITSWSYGEDPAVGEADGLGLGVDAVDVA